MNKSDSIGELMKATIAVMQEVKGIDKTMVIGTGNNSYKGVPDQEVKKIIGESMAKNGLAIFPIDIEENTQLSEWDETSQQYGTKRKQSIFTKVKTTYLLTHVSGEFITLMGYGHGVDSQDKSAGKATTYALKYALLYTFLIPTGKIDDSDTIHSDNIETPAKAKETENKVSETKVNESKMLVEATKKIADAKTVEELGKVWELLPSLQKNTVFIKMVTDRKVVLTPKPKEDVNPATI